MLRIERCTGTILLEDVYGIFALMGERSDGQGYCFPGGKLDDGEDFKEAAVREYLEETGVQLDPLKIVSIGQICALADVNYQGQRDKMIVCPTIFVGVADRATSNRTFIPNRELQDFRWVNLAYALDEIRLPLFAPSRASIERFQAIFPEVLKFQPPDLRKIGLREEEGIGKKY